MASHIKTVFLKIFQHLIQHTGNSLNNEGSVVKSGDELLESTERFRDVDLHLHDQVDAVSLEQRVPLFVEDNYDVARLKSRFLISRNRVIYCQPLNIKN